MFVRPNTETRDSRAASRQAARSSRRRMRRSARSRLHKAVGEPALFELPMSMQRAPSTFCPKASRSLAASCPPRLTNATACFLRKCRRSRADLHSAALMGYTSSTIAMGQYGTQSIAAIVEITRDRQAGRRAVPSSAWLCAQGVSAYHCDGDSPHSSTHPGPRRQELAPESPALH